MTNTQREWEGDWERLFYSNWREFWREESQFTEQKHLTADTIGIIKDFIRTEKSKSYQEGAAAERERNYKDVIGLFSGKKVITSDYIPRDEVWVGKGKSRMEILTTQKITVLPDTPTKDKGEDVSSKQ